MRRLRPWLPSEEGSASAPDGAGHEHMFNTVLRERRSGLRLRLLIAGSKAAPLA